MLIRAPVCMRTRVGLCVFYLILDPFKLISYLEHLTSNGSTISSGFCILSPLNLAYYSIQLIAQTVAAETDLSVISFVIPSHNKVVEGI